MAYRDEDRLRDEKVAYQVQQLFDELIGDVEPPQPDPDTYIFDTASDPEWSFTPEHGTDVKHIQLEDIPTDPIKSYTFSLWMSGALEEKRGVYAWVVAGTGEDSDNKNKFSDLVGIARGAKVRWRQGFGVNQEGQIPTESRVEKSADLLALNHTVTKAVQLLHDGIIADQGASVVGTPATNHHPSEASTLGWWLVPEKTPTTRTNSQIWSASHAAPRFAGGRASGSTRRGRFRPRVGLKRARIFSP